MNIWRLIAHHESPYDAIEQMKQRSRIAIGWTAIGDLRQKNVRGRSDIATLISEAYPEGDNAHLGGPSLWNLYQNMDPGDLVILNAKSQRICVFEVTGPYVFESGAGGILGYSHQRAASLTDLNPEDLWNRTGSAVAGGQNIRWTLAGCSESAAAKDAIYKEGIRFSIVSTAIERNPVARRKCIEHFGCNCFVCKFDFGKVYGELGADYIHVHHKTEISTRDGEHEVDPIRDLVPLCPNCHAMIHQKRPSLTIEELASIYSRNNAFQLGSVEAGGRMQRLQMEFSEIEGGADPAHPLIYLWEIVDRDGEVCCRYVGKASRGAHRPRTQYRRNVNNILHGRPYRKSKPDEFRAIHRRMAEAVEAGHTLRLSLLCNVGADENINLLERKWQLHYGL